VSAQDGDFPVLLVRAAALQLGDRQLAERYAEEWLSSLPQRSRYLRWRYALSLFLHGAQATRLVLRRTGGRYGPLTARLRVAVCLLAITPAVVPLVVSYYLWNDPYWVFTECGWYLMIGALLALSLSNRHARWVAGAGILLSLVQTWLGTNFFQVADPGPFWEPGNPWVSAGAWVSGAASLGAVFGGVAVVFSARSGLFIRILTALGVCTLAANAGMTVGSYMQATVGLATGGYNTSTGQPYGFINVSVPMLCFPGHKGCYQPFFAIQNQFGVGAVSSTANILLALIIGAGPLLLGALIFLISRVLAITISVLRVAVTPQPEV
jgi:hypothetical protein